MPRAVHGTASHRALARIRREGGQGYLEDSTVLLAAGKTTCREAVEEGLQLPSSLSTLLAGTGAVCAGFPTISIWRSERERSCGRRVDWLCSVMCSNRTNRNAASRHGMQINHVCDRLLRS